MDKLKVYYMGAKMPISIDQFMNFLDEIKNQEAKNINNKILDFISKNLFPIIDGNKVLFAYFGTAESVSVAGDFNNWISNCKLNQYLNTQLYFIIKEFDIASRLDYKLVIDDKEWIADPLNPNQSHGGYGFNSEIVMPEYILPECVKYNSSIKHGSIEYRSIYSNIMKKDYDLKIYLPADYNQNSDKRYSTVYFQDGYEYIDYAKANNTIDNLIAAQKIEDLIAVFIKPNERNGEYAYTYKNEYCEFFTKELLPFIDASHKTISTAGSRLVIGDSFGGNIALRLTYDYPEIFQNCGMQSPALWTNNFEEYNKITSGIKTELNFYVIWGSYEHFAKPSPNELVTKLADLGYKIQFNTYPQGHSWGLWKTTLPEMLLYFFPKENSNIKSKIALSASQNPFYGKTNINVTVSDNINAIIKLQDSFGHEIKTIFDGLLEKGNHSFAIDIENLSCGSYVAVVKTNNKNHIIKLNYISEE